VKFVGAGKSDVGRVRSGNEDAFLVDHGRALFAVADGMGGHQAGEIASHTAIETLRAEFDADEDIADAITQANRAVYTKAHSNVEWEGMGTTLTAVAIVGRLAIVGHPVRPGGSVPVPVLMAPVRVWIPGRWDLMAQGHRVSVILSGDLIRTR
jgi:serine/threonine protein phosphatase PrpC